MELREQISELSPQLRVSEKGAREMGIVLPNVPMGKCPMGECPMGERIFHSNIRPSAPIVKSVKSHSLRVAALLKFFLY